jgi:hypothetical protein
MGKIQMVIKFSLKPHSAKKPAAHRVPQPTGRRTMLISHRRRMWRMTSSTILRNASRVMRTKSALSRAAEADETV